MPRMMLRAAVLMIVCPLWSLSAVQAQTPANGETAGERGLKAWWHRHVTHVRHEAEVPEDTAGVVVIRAQSPLTHLDDEDDELYAEAKRTVIEAGKASTSYLQRKLGVGYARAARLMDILEERGVIGAADGAKPRDIIGEGNADELAAAPTEEEEESKA